jgi:hypothetical protein
VHLYGGKLLRILIYLQGEQIEQGFLNESVCEKTRVYSKEKLANPIEIKNCIKQTENA